MFRACHSLSRLKVDRPVGLQPAPAKVAQIAPDRKNRQSESTDRCGSLSGAM